MFHLFYSSLTIFRDVVSRASHNLTFVPVVFICSRIWGSVRHILGAHFYHVISSYAIVWIVPLQVRDVHVVCIAAQKYPGDSLNVHNAIVIHFTDLSFLYQLTYK